MRKKQLIDDLRKLPFNELLIVINEALDYRSIRKTNDLDGLPDETLFILAKVMFGSGYMEYFQICAEAQSLEENTEHPCESGVCIKCNSPLTSTSKIAKCPVCGNLYVELT